MRARGQAAVEVLAAVPVLLVAGLLAWQLAAAAWASVAAEEALRRAALRAGGPPGAMVTLSVAVPVPGPLASGLRATARGVVRLP